MALKNLKELSDNELESVSGGLHVSNTIEDGFYHLGMEGCGYAYKVPTDKIGLVASITKSVDISKCNSIAEAERLRLDALLAEPGLLTKIDGCNESWY